MTEPAVQTTFGWTITFVTSGFTAEFEDLNPPGFTRGNVDVSHQEQTQAGRLKLPIDLHEITDMTFVVHYKPSVIPPVITYAIETITLTSPEGTIQNFQGFMSGFQPRGPFLDKMTADVSVTPTGGQVNVNPAGASSSATYTSSSGA